MIAEREKDDVETKDKIKQMLVDAINEKHSGLNPSTACTAEHLIFKLTTGLPSTEITMHCCKEPLRQQMF